ncbi:MAG: hypothetical protein WDA42_00485 [Candidatus Bathyarchaeia archaeon]
MDNHILYNTFIHRLKKLSTVDTAAVCTLLSNIFTLRTISNNTHGGLAEIAIVEFINHYFNNEYTAIHVGKEYYRSNNNEIDIALRDIYSECVLPLSIKTYGLGAIQLATDKNSSLYAHLNTINRSITDTQEIKTIISMPCFTALLNKCILCLIYEEQQYSCNIVTFDFKLALDNVAYIEQLLPHGRRKHIAYRFFDTNNTRIFEIRCGGKSSNALQRGLWTHTTHSIQYFNSIFEQWQTWTINNTLLQLITKSLIAPATSHAVALQNIISHTK